MKDAFEIVPNKRPIFYSKLFLVEKTSRRWRSVVAKHLLEAFEDGDCNCGSGLHERRSFIFHRLKACTFPGINSS